MRMRVRWRFNSASIGHNNGLYFEVKVQVRAKFFTQSSSSFAPTSVLQPATAWLWRAFELRVCWMTAACVGEREKWNQWPRKKVLLLFDIICWPAATRGRLLIMRARLEGWGERSLRRSLVLRKQQGTLFVPSSILFSFDSITPEVVEHKHNVRFSS